MLCVIQCSCIYSESYLIIILPVCLNMGCSCLKVVRRCSGSGNFFIIVKLQQIRQTTATLLHIALAKIYHFVFEKNLRFLGFCETFIKTTLCIHHHKSYTSSTRDWKKGNVKQNLCKTEMRITRTME